MVADKKRLDKNERKKQILESALNVFISKGYKGATTIDIAKEAGISEVTLFRYFRSKKEIFMEAIEPILVNGLKETMVASKDLSPTEKLKAILKNRIKFTSSHQGVIKLILMESQINPEVGEFHYINQVVLMLIKSIKEAGISLKDEDLASRLLMGSILSFLYMPEKNEDEINKYVDNIIYNIVKGELT